MKKPVLIIGGPTASGKSGLAVAVAEKLSGVVINGDSMQIYQGLPLLTAQPTAEDSAKVPHRLYAALPPAASCSAAQWRELALAEIGRAAAENRFPIIVGGTGFYLKTLLLGISPIPDIPPEFRRQGCALQKELGNPGFHQELARRDPVMAGRLHPSNTQRLIRAWEVLEATGKSLAEWQALPPDRPPESLRFLTVALLPPRALLYASCNARFAQMLAKGVLEEVKQFKEQASAEITLSKALGYPELSAHLEGRLSLEEAVTQAQQSTRRYAKRQVTWFRHQLSADLVMDDADSAVLLTWLKKSL